MSSPLSDAGHDILDAAAAALTAPPERQFLSVDDPAVFPGCEQLSVHLVELRAANEFAGGAGDLALCVAMRVATFQIQLWRCYPHVDDSPTPPSFAEVDTAATGLTDEGWQIFEAMLDLIFDASPCQSFGWPVLTPLAPAGGMAGMAVTVSLVIDDALVS